MRLFITALSAVQCEMVVNSAKQRINALDGLRRGEWLTPAEADHLSAEYRELINLVEKAPLGLPDVTPAPDVDLSDVKHREVPTDEELEIARMEGEGGCSAVPAANPSIPAPAPLEPVGDVPDLGDDAPADEAAAEEEAALQEWQTRLPEESVKTRTEEPATVIVANAPSAVRKPAGIDIKPNSGYKAAEVDTAPTAPSSEEIPSKVVLQPISVLDILVIRAETGTVQETCTRTKRHETVIKTILREERSYLGSLCGAASCGNLSQVKDTVLRNLTKKAGEAGVLVYSIEQAPEEKIEKLNLEDASEIIAVRIEAGSLAEAKKKLKYSPDYIEEVLKTSKGLIGMANRYRWDAETPEALREKILKSLRKSAQDGVINEDGRAA